MGRKEASRASLHLLAVVLFLCIAHRASAQTEPTNLPSTGDSLRVFLVTFEPGDDPQERFGHDAIIVLDDSSGLSWAYNYGVFDWNSPHFIANFLTGKMRYWMDVAPAGIGPRDEYTTLLGYKKANRSIWLDEIDLTAPQRLNLFKKLEWNRLPENKYYRYDYYTDNCTTRVRDMLDDAVGGEIKRQLFTKPTNTTYRWHTRIAMAEYFWLYAGLELAMSRPTDIKLTAWEESFMPARLMEDLKAITIDDGAGGRKPLVGQSTQLYTSTRTPIPDSPPAWWWIFFLMGSSIGAAMALAGHRNARKTFIGLAIFWSLICTLAAVFLLAMWGFTDHDAGYRNENLLQFSPLSFAILACAIRSFRWKSSMLLAQITLGLAAAGVLVKVLPWFYEVNWELICFALPAHAGLVAGLWNLCRTQSAKSSTGVRASARM